MKNTVCFTTEIAGMPISLTQQGRDNFTVTYWKQVKAELDYNEAGKELGYCIMHACACNSTLDNRDKGGK